MTAESQTHEGWCSCRQVHYRLAGSPLFVHCCHCRGCQRERGAAFALNALYETARLSVRRGTPRIVDTPSESGKGQRIARCPHGHVALWSHYAGAGERVVFVRVGTLADPDAMPPDIHMFTASRQPWMPLPAEVPAVPEYYDRQDDWPEASLRRRAEVIGTSAA